MFTEYLRRSLATVGGEMQLSVMEKRKKIRPVQKSENGVQKMEKGSRRLKNTMDSGIVYQKWIERG